MQSWPALRPSLSDESTVPKRFIEPAQESRPELPAVSANFPQLAPLAESRDEGAAENGTVLNRFPAAYHASD
jgi:hypothetical protein